MFENSIRFFAPPEISEIFDFVVVGKMIFACLKPEHPASILAREKSLTHNTENVLYKSTHCFMFTVDKATKLSSFEMYFMSLPFDYYCFNL